MAWPGGNRGGGRTSSVILTISFGIFPNLKKKVQGVRLLLKSRTCSSLFQNLSILPLSPPPLCQISSPPLVQKIQRPHPLTYSVISLPVLHSPPGFRHSPFFKNLSILALFLSFLSNFFPPPPAQKIQRPPPVKPTHLQRHISPPSP